MDWINNTPNNNNYSLPYRLSQKICAKNRRKMEKRRKNMPNLRYLCYLLGGRGAKIISASSQKMVPRVPTTRFLSTRLALYITALCWTSVTTELFSALYVHYYKSNFLYKNKQSYKTSWTHSSVQPAQMPHSVLIVLLVKET